MGLPDRGTHGRVLIGQAFRDSPDRWPIREHISRTRVPGLAAGWPHAPHALPSTSWAVLQNFRCTAGASMASMADMARRVVVVGTAQWAEGWTTCSPQIVVDILYLRCVEITSQLPLFYAETCVPSGAHP